ncbi:HK97 gp10 family phage protein [Brevibacillus brevis]|uniref:HK97 gp10 family phage protein n=1 Tax=Brevibacillus brevis TaxID=1393 RepID=UPI001EE32060|nr:HK97 gp10 family phage protein [Brevibacillus brevis]
MARGARNGLNDVLDEWKRESTELAPLSKGGGTLRRGIQTEVSGQDLNVRGGISVSAVEMTGSGRFDYAHYIHEIYPEKYGDSFQNPTTPGTIPRFLDKPAEENKARWVQMIEDEIKAEMRAAGYEVR